MLRKKNTYILIGLCIFSIILVFSGYYYTNYIKHKNIENLKNYLINYEQNFNNYITEDDNKNDYNNLVERSTKLINNDEITNSQINELYSNLQSFQNEIINQNMNMCTESLNNLKLIDISKLDNDSQKEIQDKFYEIQQLLDTNKFTDAYDLINKTANNAINKLNVVDQTNYKNKLNSNFITLKNYINAHNFDAASKLIDKLQLEKLNENQKNELDTYKKNVINLNIQTKSEVPEISSWKDVNIYDDPYLNNLMHIDDSSCTLWLDNIQGQGIYYVNIANLEPSTDDYLFEVKEMHNYSDDNTLSKSYKIEFMRPLDEYGSDLDKYVLRTLLKRTSPDGKKLFDKIDALITKTKSMYKNGSDLYVVGEDIGNKTAFYHFYATGASSKNNTAYGSVIYYERNK